jgi:hypothetical protein
MIIGVEDVVDKEKENAAGELMIEGGCRRCDLTHASCSIGIRRLRHKVTGLQCIIL